MGQNYSNHRRFVPLYHFVLSLTLLLTMIGAGINLYRSFGTSGLYSASLIMVMSVAALVSYVFVRVFPTKAQDRVIRLEENFRHHLMDGKLLDPKLTQVEELVHLVTRICVAADRLERELRPGADVPIDQFRSDMRREAHRARH